MAPLFLLLRGGSPTRSQFLDIESLLPSGAVKSTCQISSYQSLLQCPYRHPNAAEAHAMLQKEIKLILRLSSPPWTFMNRFPSGQEFQQEAQVISTLDLVWSLGRVKASLKPEFLEIYLLDRSAVNDVVVSTQSPVLLGKGTKSSPRFVDNPFLTEGRQKGMAKNMGLRVACNVIRAQVRSAKGPLRHPSAGTVSVLMTGI